MKKAAEEIKMDAEKVAHLKTRVSIIAKSWAFLMYPARAKESVAQGLPRHFEDMVTTYKVMMDEPSDTYKEILRVERSTMEELQEKMSLMERHATTERIKTLMEAMEASWLAYDLGFNECKALA
ncbi:hypothetical protein COCNU_09G000690 [Cocos nucifera]|uniref:Uncharacterized protein n=1 Tax=Cocos nucifera TaxID=13894 RepID=A0A8K0IJH7_COCNU|nr:hypothetical protein COCNU_09G000690 [Cocos nucifera]